MRMVQRSLNIIDCRIRHAAAFEDFQPLLGGFRLGYLLNHAVKFLSMLYPVTVSDEAGVGLPLWEAQSVAQHSK